MRSKGESRMGFRSLEKFNIILLAKQWRRLLRSPDSLLARFLKAKYYSNSKFLIQVWVLTLHILGRACR